MTDRRLEDYRASIDNIDAALVHLLAERFKITQAVGRYKAEVGLPPADPQREQQQVARLRALAVELASTRRSRRSSSASSSTRSSSTTSASPTTPDRRFIRVLQVRTPTRRHSGGRQRLGGQEAATVVARSRTAAAWVVATSGDSVGPSSTMNAVPSIVLRCQVAATPV